MLIFRYCTLHFFIVPLHPKMIRFTKELINIEIKMEYMITIIQYVLSAYKISGKRNDIYKILYSDPTFPSAVAIIKTLSYYGIRTNAYQADFQQIVKNDNIMIAHCRVNEGRFYIIKEILEDHIVLYDGNNHKIASNEFLNRWDGVVLVIEKAITTPKKITNLKSAYTYLFLIGLVFSVFYSIGNIAKAIQLLADYIGFSLSFLLMVKETSKNLQIPLCHIGKTFNCDEVSNSRPFSKHTFINLPIIGCIFFLFDYLSIIYSTLEAINVIACLAASFVALYLFLHQTFKIRKYCIFCIMIGGLILGNTIVKLFTISYSFEYDFNDLLSLSMIAVISAIIPLLLYKYLKFKKLSVENELSSMQIKRMPNVFQHILTSGRTFPLSDKNALVYGTDNGKYIIDTVVSLQCKHCKNVINKMVRLLHLYPGYITWRVYINGVRHDEINKFKNINSSELQITEQYKKDKEKSLELLSKKSTVDTPLEIANKTIEEFKAIVNEIKYNKIDHYPMIGFNGMKFPKGYLIEDLELLINDWAQGGYST